MEKFLKNKKIGKKLSFSYAIIIAIFIFAIVTSIICITIINSKMKYFYEKPYVNNVLQMEIRKDMQYVGKQILWAMTTDDITQTQGHIQEAETYAGYVSENIEKLTANFDNAQLLKNLSSAASATATERTKVAELAANNQNEEALEIYNSTYDEAMEKLQDVLLEISEVAEENAIQSYSDANTLGILANIIMCLIGVISIVFCIYISKIITNSIRKPIVELETVAHKMSQGDLHVEIAYESEDELGSLANNFRTATSFMNVVIMDTSHILEKLAKGDFRIEFENKDKYVGDFVSVLNSMETLMSNLTATLKQINEGSDQVAVGAQQMAESAQSLAEGATEQAGAIQELTATVENVDEMAKNSANESRKAAEKTEYAVKDAQAGQESMENLVAAMENISNVSKEIQNIIATIEDIASQTNLLSLNASIEAARAGEAGKGFAVVADQIGKLATDSAKSAVETKELIDKSLLEIENGNAITKETVSVLEGIIKSMHDFAQMAKSSNDSSMAQAEMLNQIQEGIQQIANVIQNNSAAAQESSATSQELSAQSENLKALVDQFQLA